METIVDAPDDTRFEESQRKISVLLVMGEHCAPLVKALESCHIDLLVAHDCTEARGLVENQPSVQVLLTDRTLRDRDWAGTMELLAQIPGHVQLIICCGLNDHRRMIDALELGAYDVLFQPYEPREIQRMVEAAAAKSGRQIGGAERGVRHNDGGTPLRPGLHQPGLVFLEPTLGSSGHCESMLCCEKSRFLDAYVAAIDCRTQLASMLSDKASVDPAFEKALADADQRAENARLEFERHTEDHGC